MLQIEPRNLGLQRQIIMLLLIEASKDNDLVLLDEFEDWAETAWDGVGIG